MKKLMCVILSLSLMSNVAMAKCDWSTGVKKVDGGYLYSDSCHARVGVALKDLDDRTKEVVNLRKGLELKDLALTKADQRADMWMDTTFKLEDRLNKIESASKLNQWVYFGLGVASVFAAGYAAKQVYGAGR